MPPAIPDRWIPYKACGKVIEGTRFICFKVPLKKTVQTGKNEIREIWDIEALLKTIPQLGAVVDLTNTSRYYDPRELLSAGILHKKIFMPGRVIPPEKSVLEFMDAVDEFLGKDCVAVQAKRTRLGLSTTEFLIGVHCTHGLNRTGYMVCRYMRDRLGMSAKDAIKKFEKARGYQIERENYIADLIGIEPPAPDFGNTTALKPIRHRDDMSYRSPLNDYEESEYSGDRYRRRLDYRSEGNGSGSRYTKSPKRRFNNRSEKNSSGSQCTKSPNKSYNYKYDY